MSNRKALVVGDTLIEGRNSRNLWWWETRLAPLGALLVTIIAAAPKGSTLLIALVWVVAVNRQNPGGCTLLPGLGSCNQNWLLRCSKFLEFLDLTQGKKKKKKRPQESQSIPAIASYVQAILFKYKEIWPRSEFWANKPGGLLAIWSVKTIMQFLFERK